MKIRQIGTVVLAAMVLASCSVPGTPPQAASPSGAGTAEVIQATTARTAAASATPTSTTSASASASASAKPPASTLPSVPANLGARGRGSKGGAPTPKPGTTASPQPTAQPGPAQPMPKPTAPPAQPTATPPQAQAPSTATPTEVVINFLSSVQGALNTPQNTQYLSSGLAARVASGETVGSLLNVGDDPVNSYIDFSVDDFLLGSSGVATVDATLTFNNAFGARSFQLVDEGNGWGIDSIVDTTPPQPSLNPEPPIEEQTPTPTSEIVAAPPVVQPVDVVQHYITSLVADPSGASSGQYWLPGTGSPTLEEVVGPGLLINYQGTALDDGLGSTAAVQYTFSTDVDNVVRTFELVRQGQVWFISTIY